MNRLKPSDRLSSRPDEYVSMIWTLRDLTILENDFSRIVTGRDYLFGLCSMGYESTSSKYKCPFDNRTPYSDEERTLLYFTPHQAVGLTKIQDPKCKKFCEIKLYLLQNRINEKEIDKIFRFHVSENIKLGWHLKQRMKDFILKV